MPYTLPAATLPISGFWDQLSICWFARPEAWLGTAAMLRYANTQAGHTIIRQISSTYIVHYCTNINKVNDENGRLTTLDTEAIKNQ